jgi:hypothetical protein
LSLRVKLDAPRLSVLRPVRPSDWLVLTHSRMPKDSKSDVGDWSHVEAAEGWLELGNLLEANEELERISPDQRLAGGPAIGCGWTRSIA